jgi:hypothetical protein
VVENNISCIKMCVCHPSMIGDDEDAYSDSEATEAMTPGILAKK